MENIIICELQDGKYTVRVSSEEIFPGWPNYPILLSDGKHTIELGQFDIFPVFRMLAKAFEVVRKAEDEGFVEASNATV